MSLSRVIYLECRLKRAEGRHTQHCYKILRGVVHLTPARIALMEPSSLRQLRQKFQEECARWAAKYIGVKG